MNAAIRAVTLKGLNAAARFWGEKGYQGLITGEIVELNSYAVSQILHRAGRSLPLDVRSLKKNKG